MRRFEFVQPQSAAEAIALLGRHGDRASLLAGGTDLLVEIKEGIRAPDIIIDCKRIPDLGKMSFSAAAGLSFGAQVTAREIETAPDVRQHYRSLWQAVRELGSIQVRNRATVAGNICRASPSADTLPPLLADGASVRIVGPAGERSAPMETFFTGPGRTVLGPQEILIRVEAPPPPPGTGKCYIKLGRRKAMELATVGVAVTLTVTGGAVADIRIALGAVAPTPIRARLAEAVLRGQRPSAERIAEAARVAVTETKPISNVRGSAAYRSRMVDELVRRAIEDALGAST